MIWTGFGCTKVRDAWCAAYRANDPWNRKGDPPMMSGGPWPSTNDPYWRHGRPERYGSGGIKYDRDAAGVTYLDQAVAMDRQLITSSDPDNLDDFPKASTEAVYQG